MTENNLNEFNNEHLPFEVLYSTQTDLALLKPYARNLGPKGLFPNKKSGTLVDENTIDEEFKIARAGKIEIRNNMKAEIKCVLGKTNLNLD
jgi:large subunit ribosomal protein L1